jgi:hypothetical protein
MTDLKVYKDGKLVPKHKRQQVIDDAHKSRENPWGKPDDVNPSKIDENPNFTKKGGLYKKANVKMGGRGRLKNGGPRYGDPK